MPGARKQLKKRDTMRKQSIIFSFYHTLAFHFQAGGRGHAPKGEGGAQIGASRSRERVETVHDRYWLVLGVPLKNEMRHTVAL